jgi:hypothetical protein
MGEPTYGDPICGGLCCIGTFVWLGCIIAATAAGDRKRAGAMGCLLGLLFGPLGVIAAFCVDYRPRCPFCAGRIDGGSICIHCQKPLAWIGSRAYTPEEAAQIHHDAEMQRRYREEWWRAARAKTRRRSGNMLRRLVGKENEILYQFARGFLPIALAAAIIIAILIALTRYWR